MSVMRNACYIHLGVARSNDFPVTVRKTAVQPRSLWRTFRSNERFHSFRVPVGDNFAPWTSALECSSRSPSCNGAPAFCQPQVQKRGPSGLQPLAMLSALCSYTVQLDGKTLTGGEWLPLRSGSEIIILPNFNASPGQTERRSCALFLFMPADLAAYDERVGAAVVSSPPATGPPGTVAASADSAPTNAEAAPGHPTGGQLGNLEQCAQAQATYRTAGLESMLRRASMGMTRGTSAAEEDFRPEPSGQPYRRQPSSTGGVPSQHHHQYQHRQGQTTECLLALTRLSGIRPNLLRYVGIELCQELAKHAGEA